MYWSLFQTIPVHLLWGCSYSNNPPPCLYCNSTLSTLLKLTLCRVSITLLSHTNLLATQGFNPRSTELQIKVMQNLDHSAILACTCLSWCTSNYSIISLTFQDWPSSKLQRPYSQIQPLQWSSTTSPPPPLGGGRGGGYPHLNASHKGSVSSSPGQSHLECHCSNLNFNRHHQVPGSYNTIDQQSNNHKKSNCEHTNSANKSQQKSDSRFPWTAMHPLPCN